jgi:hypothetical protein
VLGTIATTQFPKRLSDRLAEAGVPHDTATHIATDVSTGRPHDIPESLASLVGPMIHEALTSAIHSGWLVGGVVLLVMAIPTAVLVRHRTPIQ